MKIDVSSILKITGARVEIDGKVDLKDADFLGESYKFEEPLTVSGEIYNNLARDDGREARGDEEDIILFDGHEVELDDIVRDRFLMNLSGRYLCRDDCKGLCPVCGHNLNEGDCGCNREYIDPRWQALADIMKGQTEE